MSADRPTIHPSPRGRGCRSRWSRWCCAGRRRSARTGAPRCSARSPSWATGRTRPRGICASAAAARSGRCSTTCATPGSSTSSTASPRGSPSRAARCCSTADASTAPATTRPPAPLPISASTGWCSSARRRAGRRSPRWPSRSHGRRRVARLDLPHVDTVANDDLRGRRAGHPAPAGAGATADRAHRGPRPRSANTVGALRRAATRTRCANTASPTHPGGDRGLHRRRRLPGHRAPPASAEPPTAIFAVDDVVCSARRRLRPSSGVDVPGDLSLVG